MLRVRDDVIVLQTMMWPDEVRTARLLGRDRRRQAGRGQDGATCWSRRWPATSTPSEFEDDYAEAVEALVKAKIEGGEVKTHADLDQVLRRGRRPARRAAALGRRGQDRPRRVGSASRRRDEDEKPAKKAAAKKTATKKAAAKKATTKKAAAKKTAKKAS